MGASSGQPVGGVLHLPFGTARPDTSVSVNEEHKPVTLFAAFRPRDALWDRGRIVEEKELHQKRAGVLGPTGLSEKGELWAAQVLSI